MEGAHSEHDPDPNSSSDGSSVDPTQRDVTGVLNSKDLPPLDANVLQSSLCRRETGENPDYFI